MKTKLLILPISFWLMVCASCKKDDTVSVNSPDFSVSAKKELDDKVKEEVRAKNITSVSYCVVKNDKILHSNGQGFADKANNRLATDSTRYLVASVSKLITAVALMQLVEQNLISLDDDINTFLPFSVRNPNFTNEKITYRMLLTHYSSISDDPVETLDLDCYGTDCTMSLEQYLRDVLLSTGKYFSSGMFLNKKPGTVREYSNVGSALTGYLVERITKIPFDVYCKNNIFIPLSMTKTEWRLANIPVNELAIPYSKAIKNANPHYTSPDYPNGGLRTTVLDLSKFLRAVINNGTFNGKQIVSQATMAEMKKLQFGSDIQGLSFFYDGGKKLLGHTGGEKGVTAEMFYDVTTNVGVIILANDEDAKTGTISSLLYSYGEK